MRMLIAIALVACKGKAPVEETQPVVVHDAAVVAKVDAAPAAPAAPPEVKIEIFVGTSVTTHDGLAVAYVKCPAKAKLAIGARTLPCTGDNQEMRVDLDPYLIDFPIATQVGYNTPKPTVKVPWSLANPAASGTSEVDLSNLFRTRIGAMRGEPDPVHPRDSLFAPHVLLGSPVTKYGNVDLFAQHDTTVRTKQCGPYSDGKASETLELRAHDAILKVIERRTGKVLGTKNVAAKMSACPTSFTQYKTGGVDFKTDTYADTAEVEKWYATFVKPRPDGVAEETLPPLQELVAAAATASGLVPPGAKPPAKLVIDKPLRCVSQRTICRPDDYGRQSFSSACTRFCIDIARDPNPPDSNRESNNNLHIREKDDVVIVIEGKKGGQVFKQIDDGKLAFDSPEVAKLLELKPESKPPAHPVTAGRNSFDFPGDKGGLYRAEYFDPRPVLRDRCAPDKAEYDPCKFVVVRTRSAVLVVRVGDDRESTLGAVQAAFQ